MFLSVDQTRFEVLGLRVEGPFLLWVSSVCEGGGYILKTDFFKGFHAGEGVEKRLAGKLVQRGKGLINVD